MLSLRILYFEDLSVGMTETLSNHRVLRRGGLCAAHGRPQSDPSVRAFRRQDHIRRTAVHGLYTASLISAVLGTRLPGPGAIYISQTLNFRAPVKIGDTVTVTVTVAELMPEKSRARLACVCAVGAEVVLDGEALVKVPSAAKSKRPVLRL
jgi:3-hydroxybutyryl-CoA dehydratase